MGSRGNCGDNKIKLLGMFVGRTFLFWAHDSLCTFSFYTKHPITACLCRRGSYVYSIFLSCSLTPSVLFFLPSSPSTTIFVLLQKPLMQQDHSNIWRAWRTVRRYCRVLLSYSLFWLSLCGDICFAAFAFVYSVLTVTFGLGIGNTIKIVTHTRDAMSTP